MTDEILPKWRSSSDVDLITIDEDQFAEYVVDFFQANAPDFRCQCCGSKEWSIDRGAGNDETFCLVSINKMVQPKKFRPTYILTCVACGYICMFIYEPLKEFVFSKTKKTRDV